MFMLINLLKHMPAEIVRSDMGLSIYSLEHEVPATNMDSREEGGIQGRYAPLQQSNTSFGLDYQKTVMIKPRTTRLGSI
jgi:hypothetical protein